MGERFEIPPPLKGLSEGDAFGKQEAGTSRDLVNMRLLDCRNGRIRLSKRAGRSAFVVGQANGDEKIKRLLQVSYDKKNTTYANLATGSTALAWSSSNETRTDCPAVCTDKQSNVYVLDGTSGIAKYNSENDLCWKHSLPVADKDHVCRALYVDDFGGIFAGVSSGGDSTKARLWKVRQLPDNKTEQVWEIETKGYVEKIDRKGPLLYTAQNFPEKGEAEVVAYQQVDVPVPSVAMRWRASYPLNSVSVGPKDGSIFTSSEPNADRIGSINPQTLHTTARRTDWTPDKNLTSFKKRVWSWHDFSDPSGLLIEAAEGADDDDGGEILVSFDKGGKGRHLYADATIPVGSSSPANPAGKDYGPKWRKAGIGGLPAAKFNGIDNNDPFGSSMYSVAPASEDRAFRDDNLSLIPTYKSAQFASFFVIRFPIESTVRTLFSVSDGSSSANARIMNVNHESVTTTSLARPGCISIQEPGVGTYDIGSSVTAAGGGSAPGGVLLGGVCGPYGHAIVTYICDGGIHDVPTTATRSTLRVNGKPCERWQSQKFGSIAPVLLGAALNGSDGNADWERFAGEMGEILVLSDWENADGILQQLIDCPAYPDANASTPVTTGSEVEQIEGYLAHRWGLSHLLPGGPANWLKSTANPAIDETVTIATVVYRFRAALAQANDVLIGSDTAATLLNLCNAINHTGDPGVDYYYSTTANPTYYATPPLLYSSSATSWAMAIYSRSSYRAASTDGTTETCANSSWTSATTQQKINGSGANTGHYPHAYHLNTISGTISLGGPPSSTGATTRSIHGDLNSPYGILAKWDPANGNLKWVCCSNAGHDGFGRGGIGYGEIVNSAGEIYCMGPRQAVVTSPAVLADAIDVRKIVDSGTSFATSGGATALATPWEAAPGAWTYHYPRMSIDKFDNVYVPYHNTVTDTKSLLVYQRASTVAATVTAVLLVAVDNLTDDPQAFACAIDPLIPEYETDLSATSNPIAARAQHVYLATRNETGSNKTTVYKIRLVSATPATGTPRGITYLAVAGTALKSFTSSGFTAISTPFESTSQFVDATTLYQKGYFTDGKLTTVYDAKLGTSATLTATGAGQVPLRCKLIGSWNGRLILARNPDDPHNWFMSARGDPKDWDYFPPVFKDGIAVKGNDSRIGTCPDIINAIVPYSDDILIFGGERTIQAMYGDPTSENAQYGLVTDTTGMAFGPSWDKDENGVLYFFGSKGGLYAMAPGAKPVCISETRIERKLRDIDFENYYVQCIWNPRDRGLHVLVMPFGDGGTQVAHYFWQRDEGKLVPFQDYFGTSTQTYLQPTAAMVIDNDALGSRVLLMGTEDGQILKWDETSTNDGVTFTTETTMPIFAKAVIGPLTPGDGSEWRFSRLKVQLGSTTDGCLWRVYANDVPDKLREIKDKGSLRPGQNPILPVRVKGSYVWLELQAGVAGETFSFEGASLYAENCGRARVRA